MSTDPKYLGPGYWASWHLKSIHANTTRKKAEIARNIALDIANFPCLKCKNHAKEYVSRNPLIDAVKDKDEFSIFNWTINFHNEVNVRLNKKTYTLEDAKALWTGDKSFCVEDCDQLEIKKEEEEKIRKEEIKKQVMEEMKEEIRKQVMEEMREEAFSEIISENQTPSDSVKLGKMLIKRY